jgi:signal transduction histidine kinase
MTLRLVGLMSVVLLLSLAAFGLMMQSYQDEVMEEVARTVSRVGQATLSSLESGDGNAWSARHVRRLPPELQRELDELPHPGAGQIVVVETHTSESAETEELRTTVKATAGAYDVEWVEDRLAEPGEAACVALREMLERRTGGDQEVGGGQFFIKVEEVKVESDPTDGNMVLHIPTFRHAQFGQLLEDDGEARDAALFGAGDAPLTRSADIRLPIGVEDYSELFSTIRGRSLFMFLGVLVVGTVLSAGLASRFTKPIRQLDAGIRRLSDGDLDVEVDVVGEDEIARLGTAFNDMTHKLRANRERSREVVRREKLSALGRLAAGVAHDVRNPLHSIGLTLQHMRETCRPGPDDTAGEFDRSMDIIRGEIRRLDQLVVNFLRFARSDRSERQPVDLADLLRETARLVRKEAEWRGVQVELDINEAVPAIAADGEALRSSLLNLVLNSFDAMPDGGTLRLSLGVEGESVLLGVGDTGRGISAENREKVFDFAYTTRKSGSGLGLAMVHQTVVEEHGGHVGLDSSPEEGTLVRLAIPIRPPDRDEEGSA